MNFRIGCKYLKKSLNNKFKIQNLLHVLKSILISYLLIYLHVVLNEMYHYVMIEPDVFDVFYVTEININIVRDVIVILI